MPKPLNPVGWWHGLQGGTIAEQRPAPPDADAPYPNLSSVPERPTPTDPKLRQQIADSLIADRGNARHETSAGQMTDPSNPAASPALFGGRSVAPPGPAPAAAPPAATAARAEPASRPAPAAPEGPPRVSPAPRGAVAAAPLEAPAASPGAPAVPSAPPAPASLPGAVASAPAPPASPVAPAPAPQPAAAVPAVGAAETATRPSVGVPFALGSAIVPRASLLALRQLAGRRGTAVIAVTGYGEAAGAEPAIQQAGISLALARAQAVAAALTAAGVPATAIRVDAEAAGRGAAARLVD